MGTDHEEAVILRGIGGFYYIAYQGREVECRAGGRLRLRRDFRPAVGDVAQVELRGEEGLITDILPRRNFLVRPPVANIDQLFIVASEADPVTDLYLIDKVSVIALRQNIQPILVLNKWDLKESLVFEQIYRGAAFPVVRASAQTGLGVEELRQMIDGKVSAFTGNSGIGKSSLLNRLEDKERMETGSISRISRGRHTTRRVELFSLCGGYLADTPGFSSFEITRMDRIPKEELEQYFPEFAPTWANAGFRAVPTAKSRIAPWTRPAGKGLLRPAGSKVTASLLWGAGPAEGVGKMKRALVIAAAPEEEIGYIRRLYEQWQPDLVLCADGGLQKADRLQIPCDVLMGDMDSGGGEGAREVVRFPAEKDYTDSQSCLREALARGCGQVVLAGATGGRLDHLLCNLHLLEWVEGQGAHGYVVDGGNVAQICAREWCRCQPSSVIFP